MRRLAGATAVQLKKKGVSVKKDKTTLLAPVAVVPAVGVAVQAVQHLIATQAQWDDAFFQNRHVNYEYDMTAVLR